MGKKKLAVDVLSQKIRNRIDQLEDWIKSDPEASINSKRRAEIGAYNSVLVGITANKIRDLEKDNILHSWNAAFETHTGTDEGYFREHYLDGKVFNNKTDPESFQNLGNGFSSTIDQ